MLVCVSFFMGVRVSNQSNWCMGRIKEKRRVAAASRGQVHLNPLGIEAAIKAYKTAVLDSERMQEKIRELIRMGDFCREVCRDEEALDAYERALTCCRENENKRSPRFWEGACYCASRVDELSAHQRKDCSTMVSLGDFYADNFEGVSKAFWHTL